MPVKIMWNLWHFRNGALKIHTYKLVKERKQFSDVPNKKDKELYSKANNVVTLIEDTAHQIGVLEA